MIDYLLRVELENLSFSVGALFSSNCNLQFAICNVMSLWGCKYLLQIFFLVGKARIALAWFSNSSIFFLLLAFSTCRKSSFFVYTHSLRLWQNIGQKDFNFVTSFDSFLNNSSDTNGQVYVHNFFFFHNLLKL